MTIRDDRVWVRYDRYDCQVKRWFWTAWYVCLSCRPRADYIVVLGSSVSVLYLIFLFFFVRLSTFLHVEVCSSHLMTSVLISENRIRFLVFTACAITRVRYVSVLIVYTARSCITAYRWLNLFGRAVVEIRVIGDRNNTRAATRMMGRNFLFDRDGGG